MLAKRRLGNHPLGQDPSAHAHGLSGPCRAMVRLVDGNRGSWLRTDSRRPRSNRQRRAAGGFPSVPVGMVVTRALWFAPWFAPCAAPWAWGAGVAAVRPSALRTSASSLVVTSLLSFRNWRAFS